MPHTTKAGRKKKARPKRGRRRGSFRPAPDPARGRAVKDDGPNPFAF